MTRKHSLLIDLLLCDAYGYCETKAEIVKANMGEELISDVADTFERFGYEMAKGVFKNETELNEQRLRG